MYSILMTSYIKNKYEIEINYQSVEDVVKNYL